LEPQLTRADWDHLLDERFSIMVVSGVSEGRAKALATHDTVQAHGHRPGV